MNCSELEYYWVGTESKTIIWRQTSGESVFYVSNIVLCQKTLQKAN